MKNLKYLFTIVFVFTGKVILAFDGTLSQANPSETTEMMSHAGGGERGTLDYIIIWVGIIIVALTLIYSVKFLIKPNEDNPDHIKNIVKNEGF